MSETIEVIWEVEDGYVGHRPLLSAFYLADIEDDMSDGDLEDLLDKAIQEDFSQKISFIICNKDAVLAKMRQERDVRANEGGS